MERVKRLIQSAWEPITPRGVAAFARASTGRLWLVQLLAAAAVATVAVWLLMNGVFPTIRDAIRQLPDSGEILNERLEWRGSSPVQLAEGDIVAFSVDLESTGGVRSPADFHIEFGRTRASVHSLFGYLDFKYPAGWKTAFNRPELEPKWGAWEMPILGIVVVGTLVWLLAIWSILGFAYTLPLWLLAFFANRDLRFGQAWRMAGAALMPGALVMTLCLALYGLRALDLVALAVVGLGHLAVGWIYLALSVAFLPRIESAGTVRNPFRSRAGN